MLFYKIFSVIGAVSAWSETALRDGKIDTNEAVDLIKAIATAAGWTYDIEVGGDVVAVLRAKENG